ncbi:MAG: ArsR family transcriptional regulator, arsenate/arsenite/antimonite-responsive transcriptional [Chloroflexota bacterium]|jgi:DNA-binding transcriptional ArsR family regulator|nr:ArsR family transcriptional regulator, arsenate/arsenite/antimonite-responsive transcriptional [Chloroflexota bacterium]
MNALANNRELKAHFIGLANPTRLAIVSLLARSEMTAADVARKLKLSQPLLSWHLRVMSKAGLVETRRTGREVRVSLDRKAIREYQQRFNQYIGESPQPPPAAVTDDAEPLVEKPEVKEIASAI